MYGMDSPALADAIDPTVALFQPPRVPRQLEVDHHPARVMKIQAFTSGVRGQEDSTAACRKVRESRRSLGAIETAMKHACARHGEPKPPAAERLVHLRPTSRNVRTFVIARGAQRAVAIQLDCFVASLLAMTV